MVNTQQTIQQALLALMKEKPLRKIKVTEITARAGISRSTFYTYYDSVFAIVQEIEDDFISHFVPESEVALQGKQAQKTENFSYIRDRIEVFDILSGENGDPYFELRLMNRLKRVFYRIAEEQHCTLSQTQIALICEFSRAGKLRIVHWWHDHKDEVSMKEIMEVMDKLEFAVDALLVG